MSRSSADRAIRASIHKGGGAPTLNVRAGTLDDTSWLRPAAQIWTSSAQPWALVRDNIVSYEEQPTDFAAVLAASKKVAPRD